MPDLLDEQIAQNEFAIHTRETMARFQKFSPRAAASYEEAEKDVAAFLSDVQRMLVANPGEAIEYAAQVRAKAETTAFRWATARRLFERFLAIDCPPIRIRLPASHQVCNRCKARSDAFGVYETCSFNGPPHEWADP